MITIVIYILLRLFVPKKNYYLEGDELRHIITARNFYKLWNKSLYDLHPPFFSWMLRIFRSGPVLSFLCSLGFYFVCSALYDLLGLLPYEKTIAFLFLSFNYTLIYYSNRTFRYQMIALLGASMIYCLLLGKVLIAGLLWGLLGLTCTFAGLRGFFAWMAFGCNWITLLAFVPIFGSWLITKAQVYSKNEYYPSGVEGMVEKVRPFTLKQLFTPMYFPWVYSYYSQKELDLDYPRKIGGVFGLYKQLNILTPLALFFAVKGALLSPLWMVGVTFALLYPAFLKRYLARNSIIAIPLLGFMLAKGLPHINLQWLYFASGCAVIVFLCFNRVFFLTPPKIRARGASLFLKNLPLDGILAEGMICQPIAYWTDKRVVVLTYEPLLGQAVYQTDLAIEKFDLHYAVLTDIKSKASESIRQSCKLLATIQEDNDNYHIYEIPSEFKTKLS